jgi:hypothetical protein
MPASRSAKPSAELRAPRRSTFIAPLILVIVIAVLTVIVAALPASLAARALPSSLQASDFSGTLWHGSAGRLSLGARDAGAIEWRLHPLSLLHVGVAADVHWVKGGFVADGDIDASRSALLATHVHGGGPLEDLQTLGLPVSRGTSTFDFTRIEWILSDGAATLQSAVGEVAVADLAIPQIGNGADLGDYRLQAADGSGELTDTGGPLELRATIHYSAKDRIGQLSGTIKERADVPPALRNELSALTQLHARDAAGRIPVDLEFTL